MLDTLTPFTPPETEGGLNKCRYPYKILNEFLWIRVYETEGGHCPSLRATPLLKNRTCRCVRAIQPDSEQFSRICENPKKMPTPTPQDILHEGNEFFFIYPKERRRMA